MAVKFPNGTTVRQILPAPIEGVVTRFVFDPTSGDVDYIVESDDENGGVRESVFKEHQIEAVV